jgi:hypothetical protein
VFEKRQYPRYRITSDLGLSFSVNQVEESLDLVSLGEGGCGFFGPIDHRSLSLGATIACEFDWPKSAQRLPLRVEGIVAYSILQDNVSEYGIRFAESERKRLQPLIQRLEELMRSRASQTQNLG